MGQLKGDLDMKLAFLLVKMFKGQYEGDKKTF